MSRATFRLPRYVYTVEQHHYSPPRYHLRRVPLGGGARTVVDGPTGRLRSFATLSGAQRVCDQLNADEHKRASG